MRSCAYCPCGTSQVGFNALTNNLKPESSWSEESGYQYTDNKISAQANYFHVNFSNRLLAVQQGPGNAGNASLLSNVGGVTTNGLDAAASVRVASKWVLYNAVTFSRSTYDSNYNSNGIVIPTGGKGSCRCAAVPVQGCADLLEKGLRCPHLS